MSLLVAQFVPQWACCVVQVPKQNVVSHVPDNNTKLTNNGHKV